MQLLLHLLGIATTWIIASISIAIDQLCYIAPLPFAHLP
jgi:hypothetical protein